MTASFTASNGRDPIAEFRLAIENARPARSDLLYAGSLLVTAIRDRTLAGTDVSGAPFQPYSERYAKKKSGALGHGRVDLFGTQNHVHMLNALQVVAESDESFGVGIYANEELEERARVHNEGATIRTRRGTGKFGTRKLKFHPETFQYTAKASFEMPRRRWLDASQQDIEMIESAIGQRITERLRRL